MVARLSPKRVAARERDARVKRAEADVLAKARVHAKYEEAWRQERGVPSYETLLDLLVATRALREAEHGAPSPAPLTLGETIFECRTCGASCRGRNDGAFYEMGWARIEGIDGPNAICPTCREGTYALAALVSDGYEDARVVHGHCIAEPKPPPWNR